MHRRNGICEVQVPWHMFRLSLNTNEEQYNLHVGTACKLRAQVRLTGSLIFRP